jgi:hypothetical protein
MRWGVGRGYAAYEKIEATFKNLFCFVIFVLFVLFVLFCVLGWGN